MSPQQLNIEPWKRALLPIGDALHARRAGRITRLAVLVTALLLVFSLLASRENRTPSGVGLGADYLAFYTAGTILNQVGPSRLYDLNYQSQIYHEILPGEPADVSLPYIYPPLIAELFRPLALLPYNLSYAFWVTISVGLFVAGLKLAWSAAELPMRLSSTIVIAFMSFEPIAVECIHGGQITAIAFFFVALSVWLWKQDRRFASGLALGICAYKPTLWPVVLPMLILARQWRMLGGIVAMVLATSLLAWMLVGTEVYLTSLRMFLGFGARTNNGQAFLQNWKFVVLNSFLKLAGFSSAVGLGAVACSLALLGALVLRIWSHDAMRIQRNFRIAFAVAIAWTPLLNGYCGIYDASLLVIGILLVMGNLLRRDEDTFARLPLVFRVLLATLWLSPWATSYIARQYGLQIFTLAMIWLAGYLTHLLAWRFRQNNNRDEAGEDRRAARIRILNRLAQA